VGVSGAAVKTTIRRSVSRGDPELVDALFNQPAANDGRPAPVSDGIG